MGIVVLTMYAGDEQLFGALEAGASAFVPKDAPADDVVAAARHAAVLAARVHGQRPRRRDAAPAAPTGPQLSPRESEVLGLLADGLGVAAIAAALHQRVDDQDPHLQGLREARAANRAQAIMAAHAARADRQPGRQLVLAQLRPHHPFGSFASDCLPDTPVA